MQSAILVAGGGLQDDGTLQEWVRRRLDKASELYQNQKQLIIPLSRGTPYKPQPLDTKGFPLDESFVAAQYLLQKSIPSHDIRIEAISMDTIGNAYFARLLFIDPLEIDEITVITSDFHHERTEMIFNWIYNLSPKTEYELKFICVSDEGIDPTLINARKEKERSSIERLKKTMKDISTWEELHRWIFTEHLAYAAQRGVFKIDERTQKTY